MAVVSATVFDTDGNQYNDHPPNSTVLSLSEFLWWCNFFDGTRGLGINKHIRWRRLLVVVVVVVVELDSDRWRWWHTGCRNINHIIIFCLFGWVVMVI